MSGHLAYRMTCCGLDDREGLCLSIPDKSGTDTPIQKVGRLAWAECDLNHTRTNGTIDASSDCATTCLLKIFLRGYVAVQSEEVLTVAFIQFQVPGTDFPHKLTKNSITTDTANC